MKVFSNRRRTWATIGALVGVVIITLGILLLVGRDQPTTPAAPPTTTSPTAETMAVMVFFHRGEADDPARVLPVQRTVPQSERVATAALNELLSGPTAVERDAGYFSFFSPATADMLISLRVAGGVAHADFRDFRRIIPNASSSFGSTALLAELDATLKQYPTITSTVYSFNGDVTAFYEWLQLAPPTDGTEDTAPAIAAARQFLTSVAGMNNPAEGPFRWIGIGRAEVTFYALSPEGKPVPGLATGVSLQRGGTQWSVLGTSTSTIGVDSPTRTQTISSPVSVSGRAHAFEGTVTVRVLADRTGRTTEIGHGFVTGGGDQLRPFSGQIAFTPPDGGSGWVIFTEESAATGEVIHATSVRVGFAGQAQPPTIDGFTWAPTLPLEGDWLMLPDGAGTVTFTAQTTGVNVYHD